MYKFEDDPLSCNTEGFNSSYYKQLLDNNEHINEAYVNTMTSPEIQDAEFEEVKEDSDPVPNPVPDPVPSKEDDPFKDEENDAMKLLKHGTTKGFGQSINKLLNPQQRVDQQADVVQTFKDLFNDLNTTYGLDVKFDFNSFTNTLGYIIKPKNKAALELYLSESYSRIRAALYMMYLNAIATLSKQILDPKFIQSNSMSYTDKLLLMRELFQYIQSLDQIYENIKVKDADVQLRKLAESSEQEEDFNSEEVQNFLTALTSSVRHGDNSSPSPSNS